MSENETSRQVAAPFPFSLEVRSDPDGPPVWALVWNALERLLDDETGPAAFLGVPGDEASMDAVLETMAGVSDRFERLLVLGIGGSGLGARAALEALAPLERGPGAREVRILSNVDPATVADALEWFDPADTLLNVVTKSGGTVETLSQFALFADRIRSHGGERALSEGVVVTTDPEKGVMRNVASSLDCASLDVPPLVGGRFSVLTPVGLFPIAMAGHDVPRLLAGARRVVDGIRGPDRSVQPPVRSAAHHWSLMAKGVSVRVLWPYCDRLSSLGDWFCQLWAESLGKMGAGGRVGQTPLRALGSTDQHSLLQLFMEGPREHCLTFLTVGGPWPKSPIPDLAALEPAMEEFAGKDMVQVFQSLARGTMAALIQEDRPLIEIHVPTLDEASLGALFAHFEVETALAGYLLDINPFDQPGVETGKQFAHGLLDRPGMEDYRRQAETLLKNGGV